MMTRGFVAVTLLAALPLAHAQPPEHAMAKPLRVGAVTTDRDSAPVWDLILLRVDLEATYDNPFDSDQISVDAKVTPEDAEPWVVPCVLVQPFTRTLADGAERLSPGGPAEWQARLSFKTPGTYNVVISATDVSGSAESAPVTLTITEAPSPNPLPKGEASRAGGSSGLIRRSADDHRYFVTASGESFFLSGANVCWGNAAGTYSYDTWLPHYAEAGCNFFRAWLSPAWFTFGMNDKEGGFDRINLGNAWRLDYVLDVADAHGLYAMLCIDSFNILRSNKGQYGAWEDSPYWRENGGPLENSNEYFTNETMLNAYRDRLRYLVGRYGWRANVFAWEFWNEVDIIDHYRSEEVTAWHRDMANHLRAIDPWDHLITTSFARPPGDPAIDTLPEMDFVQTHHYGASDMAAVLDDDRRNKAAAAMKPHFHGEFGISHSGQTTAEVDPAGIHLHNALWSSVGQEHAGTPMTWWWDSYVEPQNMYPVLAAFNRWTAGFDFIAQKPRRIAARIAYAPGTLPRDPDDALVRPDKASWDPAPFNQPMTARVSRDGVLTSDLSLSRLSHGRRNHPDLHNPVTFELDAPEQATFGVRVDGVSGHGGAALEIRVDGEVALQKEFADTDNVTDTMQQYDGVYEVPLTPGAHTVVVENTGNDWFYVAYVIPWLQGEPPLRVYGLQGETQALVWVQNRAHRWSAATKEGFAPVAVEGATLQLNAWPEGRWQIERWDTVKGACVETAEAAAGNDGELAIALPPVAWDAAYRVLRLD